MIRTATPADVPTLAELEAELFGSDAWSAETLNEVLEGPGRHAWVAPGAGRLFRGYAITGPAGDAVDLLRIGVAPAAQRQAVATELLRDVIAAAATAGAARILIEVSADNAAALAFYCDQGFTEIHRRPRYYRDGSDALVMELGL